MKAIASHGLSRSASVLTAAVSVLMTFATPVNLRERDGVPQLSWYGRQPAPARNLFFWLTLGMSSLMIQAAG